VAAERSVPAASRSSPRSQQPPTCLQRHRPVIGVLTRRCKTTFSNRSGLRFEFGRGLSRGARDKRLGPRSKVSGHVCRFGVWCVRGQLSGRRQGSNCDLRRDRPRSIPIMGSVAQHDLLELATSKPALGVRSKGSCVAYLERSSNGLERVRSHRARTRSRS
jgi:hypothetical protein